MPLLLLIPLLALALLALWALLLPLALVQRYRLGRMRRRALPWLVRANAWLLLASTLLFALSAWIASAWIDAALAHAAGGLALGVAVGIAGLWTTRYERTPAGLYYTPNAWLVLLLALVVALRIVLGLWQLVSRWAEASALPGLLAGHAGLFAAGGLLLGYALAYAWGLERRLG